MNKPDLVWARPDGTVKVIEVSVHRSQREAREVRRPHEPLAQETPGAGGLRAGGDWGYGGGGARDCGGAQPPWD